MKLFKKWVRLDIVWISPGCVTSGTNCRAAIVSFSILTFVFLIYARKKIVVCFSSHTVTHTRFFGNCLSVGPLLNNER